MIGVFANEYIWTNQTSIKYGIYDIELDIKSGIKQRCTGCTTLFKLVTYKIIEIMEETGTGFVDDIFKLNILFYADDGLMLAQSLEDAELNIRKLTEIGAE